MEGVAAATTVTSGECIISECTTRFSLYYILTLGMDCHSGAMVKVGVDTKVEMIDLTEVMITEEVEMCMVILVEVVAAAVAVAIEDLKAMIGRCQKLELANKV